MSEKNTEKRDVTGITASSNPKDAEMDITTALLKAADFKEDEDNITEVEIKRNGEVQFTVRIHPITDKDARDARRSATTFMTNPAGKKLPKIEKEFDSALFHSFLIYFATTEEDKKRVWGNKELMRKTGAGRPAETIDHVLKMGEKTDLVSLVLDISGMDDEDDEGVSVEEFAKN